jgi:outer membrane receptor for ferrienterochelin and colicins
MQCGGFGRSMDSGPGGGRGIRARAWPLAAAAMDLTGKAAAPAATPDQHQTNTMNQQTQAINTGKPANPHHPVQAAQPRALVGTLLAAIALAPALRAQQTPPPVRQLDPVVVTGTRSEQRLSEAPVRTEVVTAMDLEKTESRTLADAVEWTTGVRVENDCQNCNFQQIRLLGLQGNFTQILTDGRPMLSSLASVYGVEHIPAALVEQIEIVKGGGSALYGPGAIAGVINIIPRTPTRNGGYAGYRWDSFGSAPNHTVDGGIDLVTPSANAGITLFGQANTMEAWDANGDGFSEIGMRDFWSAGARAFWQPTDATRLTLDYLTLREDRRGGDRLHLPVTQAMVAEAVDSRMHQGGLAWEHEVGDKLRYELNLSLLHSERDSYYGSGMDPNAFGYSESPVYFADALVSYRFSDAWLGSLGLQYQWEKLEDSQPAYNRFTAEEVENIGALAQVEWEPGPRWNVVAGARADFNSKLDDPVLSPRLALKFSPVEEVALRASYSSGFRAPQVFDEDLHITQAGGTAQVIRNAADLAEESSRSFMLGAAWRPFFSGAPETPATGSAKNPGNPALAAPSRHQPLTLEANTFFTRLSDTFDIVETNDPATVEQEFTRINASGADIYGIELNLAWFLADSLRLDLGYVEQRSRFDQPAGDFGSRNFDRTPERYGLVGLTWNAPWCDLFLGGKFTGPMEVPHFAGYIAEDRLEKSPPFFTVDLILSKTVSLGGGLEGRLQAGVKNLFDAYQDDLDRGPDRDAGYVYGPRFPRQFIVGCEITF